MVHRYKNCTDILKVTSGGRAEIESVKNDKPTFKDVPGGIPKSVLLGVTEALIQVAGQRFLAV